MQLHQLTYFSQLAGAIEGVTAAQLAAVPRGEDIPLNAVVKGVMPDALKAILHWKVASANEFVELAQRYQAATLVAEREAISPQGLAATKTAADWEKLFLDAFDAQVGTPPNAVRGWGPNYEMYYIESEEPQSPWKFLYVQIADVGR